jgi:hypothetical protein
MGVSDRRPAVESLIAHSPYLFVKRDDKGYVHVHYPLTSEVRREMIISPSQGVNPDTPYVSILITDVPGNLSPDAPVTPSARLVLKPVNPQTFEIDSTEARNLSFQEIVKPLRQGFNLLTAFLLDPPIHDNNPYTDNVLDEFNLVNGVKHIGSFINPAAPTFLNYMDAIINAEPLPYSSTAPAPTPPPATA